MPPPEHKPQEYGRPMSIQFNIVQDAFIPKEALIHMVIFHFNSLFFVNLVNELKLDIIFLL